MESYTNEASESENHAYSYAEDTRALSRDMDGMGYVLGERPSTYLLQARRRQGIRAVTETVDTQSLTHKTNTGILEIFVQMFKEKFDTIMDEEQFISELDNEVNGLILPDLRECVLQPVTAKDLRVALGQGAKRKSPGFYGLSLEFYISMWEYIKEDMLCIYNEMLLRGCIQADQKTGIIVCIPKHAKPTTPLDFRPITLLDTDYKILTRLLANRLRQSLPEIVHPGQHCGVPERNIFDAITGQRDVLAFVELTGQPLCRLLN